MFNVIITNEVPMTILQAVFVNSSLVAFNFVKNRKKRFKENYVWNLTIRGGVLVDTFWSPWPWSLKSSKNCPVLGARGQHDSIIFEPLKFRWKNARNLAENLQRPFFSFSQVEIAWKKNFEDLFSPEKNFLKTFFFWKTLATVSFPWSLASKGSVLGLGLDIFFVSLALTLASSLESSITPLLIRSGVEDTRLEAKAKDTKKNPRPRPRTAFPRTDTLEAKDRNARSQGQGHKRLCSPKKKKEKVFTKSFYKRSTKIFNNSKK